MMSVLDLFLLHKMEISKYTSLILKLRKDRLLRQLILVKVLQELQSIH